ncbi:hypothetical protein FEM48_Zijuj01G0282900 [Ziziphus jujuba var. spinosa]|uniref:Uncharacterized protein n=1 Tax=Ziziphus jujuba var. spinosa TaxID=714518 RepID=A0A978W5F5_ZIZJJ|nr:hypothetical protein FEM48_Zijuj01G0282900 [Ziziphus jujuba var. spinosa]
MASKLPQLGTKLAQSAQLGNAYFKQLLERNKQYIQEPPTVENIPGRYESFQKEVYHFKQLIKNRDALKVENAGIIALFGLECYAWFCAGEIVGRGFTFTGYRV